MGAAKLLETSHLRQIENRKVSGDCTHHDHSKDPLGWADTGKMIRKWLAVEGSSKCCYLFRHMKELRHIVGLVPLLELSLTGK
jgi:hypothetical protein